MSEQAQPPTLPPQVTPPPVQPVLLNYRMGQALPTVPPGWTGVRVYGLRPEGLAPQVLRIVTLQTIVYAVLSTVLFGVYLLLVEREMVPYLATFFLGIVVVSMGLRGWRLARQTRRNWPTYRLFLSDQGLFRTCNGFPDLRIDRAQITRLRESRWGIEVRTGQRLRALMVPRSLEQYAEVRSALALVRPIEEDRLWLRLGGQVGLALALGLSTLAALAWGLYTPRQDVALACFAAIAALVTWSTWRAWRNPNVTLHQKISSLSGLILPAILLLKIAWVFVRHRWHL